MSARRNLLVFSRSGFRRLHRPRTPALDPCLQEQLETAVKALQRIAFEPAVWDPQDTALDALHALGFQKMSHGQ